MIVESDIETIRRWTLQRRHDAATVGVVPTMGALHPGHLSLVQRSKSVCDYTVATIFLNPAQFAPDEDLEKYPRTIEEDLQNLSASGVDAVFTPEPPQIYPDGFSTYVQPPEVALSFEGKFRPDHFRGVTTVVLKLLNIIPATHAFFGQKDFQQAAVIVAMCRDLNVDVQIEVCPILRDPDGLAMSSRNRYLSSDERTRGLSIINALRNVTALIDQGQRDTAILESKMREILTPSVDRIDYAAVADAVTLTLIQQLDRPAVALIAAHVGTTRLIDNVTLDPPKQ